MEILDEIFKFFEFLNSRTYHTIHVLCKYEAV